MAIKDADLRKRVLTRIIASPVVLAPTVLGATALAGAWALGRGTGLVAFLGLAGVLVGLGTLATRWIFGMDKAVRDVIEDDQRQSERDRKLALNRLDRRLRRDRDPRTERYLKRLRTMQHDFQERLAQADGVAASQLAEVAIRSRDLYRACIESLERSLMLWEGAQSMHTDEGRRKTLEAREDVLAEVAASIDHLALIFDGVRALSLQSGEGDTMASIRADLDQSLDVARRVEDRMRAIRHGLEDDPDWRREGGRWTEEDPSPRET